METNTKYTNSGATLSLVVERTGNNDVVEANLNETNDVIHVNNKSVVNGELAMLIKNTEKAVNVFINDKGELLISGKDAKNYSLNGDGELIYKNR